MPKPGQDHEHYVWSPISKRPAIRWPNGARAALCVMVVLDLYEWRMPAGGFRPNGTPPHGARAWSHHEYGHRIGIFAVMDVLDKHGIRATIAMDAGTADNYPAIVRECQKRDWEFIGHGMSLQQPISTKMTEEQERKYVRTSLDSLQRATGTRPIGWLGIDFNESSRTPGLLADEGIQYICDWPNDEQPYRMKTRNAYFLPTLLDLDDEYTMGPPRYVPVAEYGRMLQSAFDTIYRDSAAGGRMMAFSLHPYLIGQPFRVKHLDSALGHISKFGDVWKATGKDIIEAFAATQEGANTTWAGKA
jgi:allantoinase